MRRKFVLLSALGLAVAAPLAPAAAQASSAIAVGMQVVDATGAAVGSVKAIQGENILVKTDKHEALLPKNSFTASEGKLLFGMTQAQLNAEIEKGLAAADASVAAGATVKGVGGETVGAVDAATAEAVTITLTSGKKVQLSRTAVRGNADGSVSIGVSAEQLEAQVEAAGAGASDAR